MYMGYVELKALTPVAAWDAWLGVKETACVYQYLINFFCQVIIGKVCEGWVGTISLCKGEVEMEAGACFGLSEGFGTSDKDRGTVALERCS